MIFDICLYKFCAGKLSQYPTLEYAKDVINESRKLTFSLRGKRQLSLVKRGTSGKVLLYNIYNYVYNDKNDAVGICIVFHDKYPHDIEFLFKFCGLIIAEIIQDGKAFYFDSKGNIISDKNDLEFHHSTLSKHKEKIKATLQNVKTKVRAIPRNVYNNFEDQHVICQLSDKSWSLDEIFKTNNVVIITEEIEEENINSMRSFIKKSNETVDDLNKKIKKLEEQLKKVEREKKKQFQTKPPHKQSKKPNDNGMDATAWITLGVIGAIILLNVIAPWFIPSVWPKLSVVFTVLGTYVVIKALNDDSNKKIYEILGWSGAVAILLSTVCTIYGLCGGFSPDTVDEGGNMQTVTDIKNVPESEQENITTIPALVTRIPNNFVRVSSGASDFYIDKYEVTQKEYATLMENNPSKYQGDSLPVHGMSVRDAVIYCNRKSEADGLRGFYEINGNAVTLKSDGNGYRLPTEKEWVLASKKTKEITHEKPFPIRPHAQDVRTYDFKPHAVGDVQDKRRELFDVYGNVSELCVRSNGEIWGKGGSYRIALGSETSEDGGLKAAENLSSTIHLNADFGLRLVFIL